MIVKYRHDESFSQSGTSLAHFASCSSEFDEENVCLGRFMSAPWQRLLEVVVIKTESGEENWHVMEFNSLKFSSLKSFFSTSFSYFENKKFPLEASFRCCCCSVFINAQFCSGKKFSCWIMNFLSVTNQKISSALCRKMKISQNNAMFRLNAKKLINILSGGCSTIT